MKKNIVLLGLGVLFLSVVGCQTVPYQGQAREVKKKPQEEGVIALTTNHRDEDRAKAEEKMKSNCAPFPVKVLEEGEVVIGQESKSDGKETERKSSERSMGKFLGMNMMTGEAGGKNTSSSTTTTSLKEWQIAYKCERKATAKR